MTTRTNLVRLTFRWPDFNNGNVSGNSRGLPSRALHGGWLFFPTNDFSMCLPSPFFSFQPSTYVLMKRPTKVVKFQVSVFKRRLVPHVFPRVNRLQASLNLGLYLIEVMVVVVLTFRRPSRSI